MPRHMLGRTAPTNQKIDWREEAQNEDEEDENEKEDEDEKEDKDEEED